MTDEEIINHKWTIDEVEDEIKKVYLLVDRGIISVLVASVIANRIKSQQSPVWLLILAGSSGGKSIMLNLFSKCGEWIIPIDTLTTNTFASGLKRDTETSLLHEANGGVLFFKDFTVLTTMNEEGLREIMGQLRAIFDGSFNKKTGNAVNVDWTGKIGCIAAGTIEVQRKMRQFSQQGERFLNYIIDVADSKDITKRAMANQGSIKDKELYLQKIMAAFVSQILLNIMVKEIEMSDEIETEMINVANFCTLARSPVIMSKKDSKLVEFISSREEPPRMANMLKNLAVALMFIRKEEQLSEFNAGILYKVGLDSIPVERRMCLKILSEYRNSNTQSIAIRLRHPTETVVGWLNQLNALDIVGKKKDGQSFVWEIKKEYRDIMVKYLNLTPVDEELVIENDYDGTNAYVDESIKKLNDDVMQLDMGYDDQNEDSYNKF